MNLSQACEALRSGKRVAMFYDGHERVVEIHAVGTSSEGNGLLRVFQVRGGSNSGNAPPWRMLRVERIQNARILDEASSAPRPGYKRGDSDMETINCQI
jgi:hypothetical protein